MPSKIVLRRIIQQPAFSLLGLSLGDFSIFTSTDNLPLITLLAPSYALKLRLSMRYKNQIYNNRPKDHSGNDPSCLLILQSTLESINLEK